MKKKLLTGILATALATATSMTAFAGQWQSDANGWWYQNDNGGYPTNTWQWIDGNNDGTAESYYFDSNGYCLMNTTTPDGYTVNPAGAWIIDGVVQTKNISDTSNGNNENQTRVDLSTSGLDTNGSGCHIAENVRTSQNLLWSKALEFKEGSYVDFFVNSSYKSLTFTAAPCEGFKDFFAGTFEVYGDDDELLYISDTVNYKTNPFTANVNISNQQYIKLVWNLEDTNSTAPRSILIKDAYIQ